MEQNYTNKKLEEKISPFTPVIGIFAHLAKDPKNKFLYVLENQGLILYNAAILEAAWATYKFGLEKLIEKF